MTATVETISGDQRLQDHWISRIIAAVIDGVLTWLVAVIGCIPLIIVANLALIGWVSGLILPFIWGLVYVMYSAAMESSRGSTIGKRLVKLRVVTISGAMTFERALKRNITKIYWAPLLADVLVGFFTEGDPRQRYMDRVAGTTVVFDEPAPMTPYTPQPPPPPQYAPSQGATVAAGAPAQVAQECAACGGRLIDSGDGRRQCIRCGKVY